jgi:hypothetical protein
MDYYLSFPDEATAKAVLYRIEGDAETVVQNFTNIDTIGVIHKDDHPIDGWHVNVRVVDGEDGSALEPFSVNPKTPIRVWG